MSKTAVILQSNYLPWRGYFDLMRRADVFIVLDIVQYSKNDWRNRNVIKTPSGPQWLTIPVHASLGDATSIDAVTAAGGRWADKHIKTLKQNYSKAAAFAETAAWLFPLIEACSAEPLLSKINVPILQAIAARIGIKTPIVQCTDFAQRETLLAAEPTPRLVDLCAAAGATRYLSGPAAQTYLDVELFRARGIEVEWMSYEGYPEYSQLWGTFNPRLSIVDLIFNTGANASSYFPKLPARVS